MQAIISESQKSLVDVVNETYRQIGQTPPKSVNLRQLLTPRERPDGWRDNILKHITTGLYRNGSDHRSTKNGSPDKLLQSVKDGGNGILTLGVFGGIHPEIQNLVCLPKRVKSPNGNRGNRDLEVFSSSEFHQYMCKLLLRVCIHMNSLPDDVKACKDAMWVEISPTALEYVISTLEGDNSHIKRSHLDNVFNPRRVFHPQERAKVIGK
jgi:hypothetical protein